MQEFFEKLLKSSATAAISTKVYLTGDNDKRRAGVLIRPVLTHLIGGAVVATD